MSVQKFIVSKESSNYTIIPNKVIQGLKSQLELLGLYTYLLSLPPEWTFYKTNLKETTGFGIKKLERFLNSLVQMNLIKVAQMRNENGQFAHFDLCILNGDSFKINNLEDCAPKVKNRRTVNGGTVLGSYKRNTIQKKEIEKKHTCATEEHVARENDGFDEFWKEYPRKKDKFRAKEKWKKKGLNKKAELILNDIRNRKAKDVSWMEERYIPYPVRYLDEEHWDDAITVEETQKNEKRQPKNESKPAPTLSAPKHEMHCTVPDVSKVLDNDVKRSTKETALENVAKIKQLLSRKMINGQHGRQGVVGSQERPR